MIYGCEEFFVWELYFCNGRTRGSSLVVCDQIVWASGVFYWCRRADTNIVCERGREGEWGLIYIIYMCVWGMHAIKLNSTCSSKKQKLPSRLCYQLHIHVTHVVVVLVVCCPRREGSQKDYCTHWYHGSWGREESLCKCNNVHRAN